MNKKLSLSLIILSILALTFASAFTVVPKITSVSLNAVRFQKEKGVTFKFLMTGDIQEKDLVGNVQVGRNKLELFCRYNGKPSPVIVTCRAAKGTATRFAGRHGLVTVAGHTFEFTVPARLP